MIVETLDVRTLSDEDLRAYHDLRVAITQEARPGEPEPTFEMTAGWLRNAPPGYTVFARVVRGDAGGFAGAGAGLVGEDDNKHLMQISHLWVHPGQRRRGIGTGLLRGLAEAADAAGATLMTATTSERVPAGAAFAARFGAEAAQGVHVNRLLLRELDRSMVDRWIAEGPGRAPGYSLFSLDGVYPDELIDEIADLRTTMNTAPRGSLQMDDMTVTPEFLRTGERLMTAQGTQRWTLFARHDASGRLVGFTEVSWNPNTPGGLSQGGTVVRPEHRGHAIGKWLKATMLVRVLGERPEVHEIRTSNDDTNAAMLAINTQLGFRPLVASTTWQASIETLLEQLRA